MPQFKSQSLAINCAGEELWLHPARVMYWPVQRTLFAADVHAGKEHVFGRYGIAMPGGISEAGLQKLFDLAMQAEAEKLVVLGDFMHASPNHSDSWLNKLQQLLDRNSRLSVHIVAGNHDKAEGQHRIDSRVHWHNDAQISTPFVLKHEPDGDERGYVLCGHLHPSWRIGRSRRSSVRTPVFWFTDSYAVMPAFGEFTGGALVDANPESDRLFMTTPDGVIEVPAEKHKKRYRF